MSMSSMATAYPIIYEGSARKYAQSWCGNTEHDGSGSDGRDCPWHVDGDLKSTNTIDSAYTVVPGSSS